eukprot:1725471-Alexandrium_andersonii.AAC.1
MPAYVPQFSAGAAASSASSSQVPGGGPLGEMMARSLEGVNSGQPGLFSSASRAAGQPVGP